MNNILSLLEYQKQIILQGPPGTGKTRLAKILAIHLIDPNSNITENSTNEEIKKAFENLGDQAKLIQFHPSFSYEDFVRGITAKTANGTIEYVVENKILAEMADEANRPENREKTYVLIIDEINRANLSSVLGELIYALEYRDEAVESMYDHPNKGRQIVLPSNLYIIGTMNTADRSVGHIDYAIRRRFAFESVLPNESVVSDKELFEKVEKLFYEDKTEKKQSSTLSIDFLPEDVQPGHSYFIGDKKELEEKLEYQVKPLLKEYIKDGVLNADSVVDGKKIKEYIDDLTVTIQNEDASK